MLSEENFLSACFVITVSFFMSENCSLKLHWKIYINPLQAPGPSSAQSSKELTVITLAAVRSRSICHVKNGPTLEFFTYSKNLSDSGRSGIPTGHLIKVSTLFISL